MKKSLIVIALALLMIVPVFAQTGLSGSAETGETVEATTTGHSTEVNVTLGLTPRYVFGITGGKSGENDYVKKFTDQDIVAATPADETRAATAVLYTNVETVDAISLTADFKNMKLKGTAEGYQYYVSYWFCENNSEKVSLEISLDGDLTLEDSYLQAAKTAYGNDFKDANTVIPYQVIIGETTLNSTSKDSATVVENLKVQSQISGIQQADVAITVEPTTVDTLEYKYTGTYVAHIILNLKVAA